MKLLFFKEGKQNSKNKIKRTSGTTRCILFMTSTIIPPECTLVPPNKMELLSATKISGKIFKDNILTKL